MTGQVGFVESYLDDLGDSATDLTSHDAYTDCVPHATFARLRRDEPVSWWDEADGSGFWAVTRHADVIRVSSDPASFTSSAGIRLEEMEPDEMEARRTLMEFDPPQHTRQRRLVSRGFTPRMVAAYEDAIRGLAVAVLDEALPKGEFDFVAEVATQLPMRMLGRMLGTSDADGRRLVEWGDFFLGNTDPEFTTHVVDHADTDEFRKLPFRSPAALEVFQYAEEMAVERRDGQRDDIITKLLAPTVDGEPLSDLEFKNFFLLLIAAGNDTTRYTMAHGLWVLMRHPELIALWKADGSVTDTAVEEILRTGSVTMHFRRTATADIELGGKQIRAGDKVVVWYPSANHDEDVFADPFRFDLRRTPNDHVTFGRGAHLCLGAWLARMEVKVVFEELLARVSGIELAGPIERLRSNFISGIKHLPVRIT